MWQLWKAWPPGVSATTGLRNDRAFDCLATALLMLVKSRHVMAGLGPGQTVIFREGLIFLHIPGSNCTALDPSHLASELACLSKKFWQIWCRARRKLNFLQQPISSCRNCAHLKSLQGTEQDLHSKSEMDLDSHMLTEE